MTDYANDHQSYEESTVKPKDSYVKNAINKAIAIIINKYGENFNYQDIYNPMLNVFGDNENVRLFLKNFKKQLPEEGLKIDNILYINNTVLTRSHHIELNKILNIFIYANLKNFKDFLENNYIKYPYLDDQNRTIYITDDQQKLLYNKIKELCESVKIEMASSVIPDLNNAPPPNEATGNANTEDVGTNSVTFIEFQLDEDSENFIPYTYY